MLGRRDVQVGRTVVRLLLACLAWWLVPLGLDQMVKLSGALYSLAAVAAGLAAYFTPRLLSARSRRAAERKPQPTIDNRHVELQESEEPQNTITRRTLVVAVSATMGMATAVMLVKDFASNQEGIPRIIYATPPFATPVPTTSSPPSATPVPTTSSPPSATPVPTTSSPP